MKIYGRWTVTLPGETYEWQPDDVTLGEQLMLETETGMSYDDWIQGIAKGRAIPCQVLVWFLRKKAGREEDRASVNFPIRRLELDQVREDDSDPEASAGSEPATSNELSESSGSDPSTSTP